MKTKHTQGKWLMNVTNKFINNPNGLAITDTKHRLIASVSHNLEVVSMGEYEANAKLITNAPKLLMELKNNNEMLESLRLKQPKGSATEIAIEKQIMWNSNVISDATE